MTHHAINKMIAMSVTVQTQLKGNNPELQKYIRKLLNHSGKLIFHEYHHWAPSKIKSIDERGSPRYRSIDVNHDKLIWPLTRISVYCGRPITAGNFICSARGPSASVPIPQFLSALSRIRLVSWGNFFFWCRVSLIGKLSFRMPYQ